MSPSLVRRADRLYHRAGRSIPPSTREQSMRKSLLTLAGLAVLAVPLPAQSDDEIVVKYLTNVGGMDKIQAVTTLRRTGKAILGGGFEAGVVQESKRPNKVRQEFLFQGMTGVNAYDGKTGWKIGRWQELRAPRRLCREDRRRLPAHPYFDEPLVNY